MSRVTQKIAVAVVHGIGKQDPDFYKPTKELLLKLFARELKGMVEHPGRELIIEPVYWAPVLQREEDVLQKRVRKSGSLRFPRLRNFMVDFAADAIAYQPTLSDRQMYAKVHQVFAETLVRLSKRAGAKAPLCVISHSLGTVISSNFFYDLQREATKSVTPELVKETLNNTPLERGETFSLFYTLGSPIALWSLRYKDYGMPVTVPSPSFVRHYPGVQGGWVNFYDSSDVIGYPLKTLNKKYADMVTADYEINVGGLLSFWNPLSHTFYPSDRKVLRKIAISLARTWKKINHSTPSSAWAEGDILE